MNSPSVTATQLFDQLETAWNRADGPAFGAVFTADSDFVDIRGDHHRGATAIGFGHQAIFDTIYAGSTVRYELESARRIADDAVLAVVRATLDAPTGPMQGISHSRISAVITEQDSRWLITGFHNTLVRAAE